MKKLFTILALTIFMSGAFAQRNKTVKVTENVSSTSNDDSSSYSSSEYKPSKGTVTTEVGLTGGLGNSAFNLNASTPIGGTPTLKFRYFLKDNIAFRLGFTARRSADNTEPNTTTTTSPVPTVPLPFVPSTTTFNSDTTFGVNLGIEKHFKGSDRLSTFVGADLLIGTRSSFVETVNNTAIATTTTTTDKNNFGRTYFGLGLITGADYYIAKKVYLGVELGISFLRLSDKDRVQTTDSVVSGVSSTTEVTTSTGGSEFELTTALNGGIRIGYQF
jgi:Outer membrane protein beta-barrel domain